MRSRRQAGHCGQFPEDFVVNAPYSPGWIIGVVRQTFAIHSGGFPDMKKIRKNNFRTNQSMVVGSLIATAVAAALGAPRAAWAQSVDATLSGYASPGAAITIRNPATGLTRHAVAGADGHFVIAGLPPGDYRVDAGPKTEQSVRLQVATTTELDLEQLDEVLITGNRTRQQARTSEVSQVVSLHDIEVLPQATRNFLEFADTVPGMTFTTDSSGKTSLRGGAQLSSNINVFIDGVSQKDYVFGGITGQGGPDHSGDPGNPFPQLAIDEYKVVTSNYSAAFGEASSAVVLAKTRSGTNEYRGEAFGNYTNQNLRAATPSEVATGADKPHSPSEEYGLAVGGPIIQDRMHFFLTWEHKSLSEQNVVFPGGGIAQSVVGPVLPADVTAQFGPTTNPFKEDLAFGKLDFEPSEGNRFEMTGKLRQEKQLQGASGQTAASAASNYKNNDNRYDLSWQFSRSNWVNEAKITHQNTTSNTNATPSQEFSYYYFPDPIGDPNHRENVINVGGPGPGVGFRYEQTGTGFKDDFTLSNLSWKGDHTLRMGVAYQGIDLVAQAGTQDYRNAQYFIPVTPTGVYKDAQGKLLPMEVQFPVTFPGIGADRVDSKDKQYNLYFQDDWNVTKKLQLNLGVRWDYEEVPGFEKYKTPQGVIDTLNSRWWDGAAYVGTETYAQLLAHGGEGTPPTIIGNYISTGSNRKPPTNLFQPRLGFSYDIDGDQNYVVFGGYARSYDKNLFNTLSYETTKVGLYNNPEIYFPTPYTQSSFGTCKTAGDVNPANHCYAWSDTYFDPASLATFPVDPSSHEIDMINNNIKTPHSDQFTLGFRARLSDWDTSVSVSEIKSYDALLGHLGLRYADGSYYSTNGNPWGGTFGSLKGYGALVLWDNGGEDRNLQVAAQASKGYTKESGWGMSVAYTFSKAEQNNAAGGNNPYSGNPNGYLFDIPTAGQYPLLPSSAVPKHRLVVTYSHDIPWGMLVAGKLTLATPQSIDTIAGCDNWTYHGSCSNPYGGNGYPISARIPGTLGYKDVDLQVSKNFQLSERFSGSIRLDVLNVFNFNNYDSGAAIWSPSLNLPSAPPRYNTTGPINGTPRLLKASISFKW
jgi:outer membrane receptor protein involved in Fe transport